jgi:two-component system, OmpR family, phosphate regulon sensor histidine kinase PhoR
MRNVDGSIGTAASRTIFEAMGATGRPITRRMTATAEPQKFSDFESLLLAIAGHDLRQPLQIIESAYELLGIGIRTKFELRLLERGQIAINRLTEQLDQLIGALRLREHAKEMKLSPLRLEPLLRQACHENEETALRKGIEIRTVSTSGSVISDALLLGTVLRNLISNAVKYTEPGGRILVGCRHVGQDIRIDVFDTGSGIAEEQLPRIFDAFTRLDHTRRDGLGIGLFIVRQAIGMLGYRVEVSSLACRGSRFSIFASASRENVSGHPRNGTSGAPPS